MIRHVVLWKLKNRADAPALAARLEALNGRIPGLIRLTAGADVLGEAQSADLALVADLESVEALAAYQAHPAHQEVVPLMREAATSRMAADFELDPSAAD